MPKDALIGANNYLQLITTLHKSKTSTLERAN